MRQKLIKWLFPRSWSVVAHGGIEIRRIVPEFRITSPLYHWAIFSRVHVGNGRCLPLETFGQRPIATGWTWGSEGYARFDASCKLEILRGRFDG